jgi:hypothetical protein
LVSIASSVDKNLAVRGDIIFKAGIYATKGAEERTRRQWNAFMLGTEHTYKKDPYPLKG